VVEEEEGESLLLEEDRCQEQDALLLGSRSVARRLDPAGGRQLSIALSSPMLSDREAEEIAREVQRGTRGPVVFKWIEQLLADRKERAAQVQFLRQRLKQAFARNDV